MNPQKIHNPAWQIRKTKRVDTMKLFSTIATRHHRSYGNIKERKKLTLPVGW